MTVCSQATQALGGGYRCDSVQSSKSKALVNAAAREAGEEVLHSTTHSVYSPRGCRGLSRTGVPTRRG